MLGYGLIRGPKFGLTFGSADTWCRDFHPAGFVPCTAHTIDSSGLPKAGPLEGLASLWGHD
jgi:hypothetical protein